MPNTLTDWGLDSLPPAMSTSLAVYDANGFCIVDGWVLGYQDKNASSLVVPEGIVGIGARALAEMYDLETVNLPQSLKYIAEGAFREDTYLDNLMIPDGVEIIGDRAFEDCSFIQTMTLGGGVKKVGARAFAGCTQLSGVTFGEGLVEIGAEAFDGCWRMLSVSLPLSVTNVASTAFNGCTSLTGVTVPTHGGKMSEWFAPVYSQIRDVTVPEGEVEVRASMFEGCGSLQTVQMPDSITNIAARAFYGCSSLTAAALPENVTSIGARAFQGCSNLSALTLPRGLEALPDYVFADCWSLDSFVVPAAVTNLGNYIVSDFTTAIYYLGNAPAYGANVYGNASGSLKSYVILGTKGWDGRPNSRDIPASWNGRDILTWSANQFDVTFDANGGLFFPVVTNTYACEETTYTGYSLPPFEPVRKGMDFDGYWTEPSGGTRVFTSTRVLLTKPHSLYAHWKKGATIEVRFNACGGTVSPAEDDYVAERPYCELPVPVREHFAFEGWWTEASGGKRVEISSEVPKAAHELFAHWTPNRYTIRFHANNGTSATVDQHFTYGDTVTLRANTFSSSGNAFAGWALSEDGPAVYADGKTLTDVAAIQDNVIHLYAVWVSTRYTVRFDSHGGVGRMEYQTLVKDEAAALYGCAFTRTGYTFAGWAVSTTGGVVYGDGESVVNVYEKTGADIVLYAVWKSIAAEMCEEVFDGVGIVSANDAWDTVVVITNDVSGTVEIPDNVGAVTIDLNGHDMVGDGGPAIRIVAGDGEGGATRLAIVDTSEGEKGQILGGGESAGIEVAEDAAPSVRFDVEEGVGVFNGDGSEQPWRELCPVEATLVAGEYFKVTLSELGFDVPTDGTPYSVVAKGLPAGLQLKYNAAVTKKVKQGKKTKTVVVKPAKSEWWIEGVPTAAMDFFTNPPYLVITANGVTTTEPLPVEVLAQNVTDLGELALGETVNEQYYLPGVTSGWAVSGLPTGLKYTAKLLTTSKKVGKKTVVTTNALPYSVYGKTTKAGLFTITAKKKVGAFYETLKYRVLVKPAPVDTALFGEELTNITTKAYVPFEWDLTNDVAAVGGKVAKVAGLPAGLAFASATTYKDKKKPQVKQYGQTIVGTPTKPGTYVVTFTKNVTTGTGKKKKTVAKTAQILWSVVENDAELELGFNTAGGVIEGGSVGLKYGVLMAFTATDGATVTASGLPEGMKLVKLDDGGRGATALPGGDGRAASPLAAVWGFQGFTEKAGTYLVTVKATLNGKTVTQRVALKVDGLPGWAKGTFNGCVRGTDDDVSGLATITVSSVGKISGKFQEGGTNWTFSAACYTGYDDSAPAYSVPVVAKYAYKATEIVKGKKKTVTKYVERKFSLSVSPDQDGVDRGVARMTEVDGSTVEAWQNLWKQADYKALGKSLFSTRSGKKTLAYRTWSDIAAEGLCDDDTLSVKVATSGAVTATYRFFKGTFDKKGKPQYATYTCAATLIPLVPASAGAEDFEAAVFVVFPPVPSTGFPGYSAEVEFPFAARD